MEREVSVPMFSNMLAVSLAGCTEITITENPMHKMPPSDDEDSLDFDITISGSIPSYGDPLTPPPTIRKSWYVKMQNRLASLAVFIFVLCIVVSIILVLCNWHKM